MSKNNKIKYVAAFVLIFVIGVYLIIPIVASGPGHNIISMYESENFAGNLKLIAGNKKLMFKWFEYTGILFSFVALLILIASHIGYNRENGPSAIPEQGIHGTARWLTYEEAKNIFIIKSGPVDGIVFGKIEKNKDIQLQRSSGFETVAISTPVGSNKNVAIYGPSGSGKSRGFVRNQVMQIAKIGQSMVITDPKGEIFQSMSGFLKDRGYDVKVLNLVNMIHSDRWNPLTEVTDDISAQSFCDTVMANTRAPGAKIDEFWEKSEMNLLKALVLYVVTTCPKGERNLATVYSMLALKDVVTLDAMFARLDFSHPAKMPYSIYSQASDKIKPNIVIGLGSKLQIFQNEIVQNLMATSDIDLTAPKYRKTAYFCITSDSESTFDFIAGLFFSFLFIKLTKYADFYPPDHQKEVYFILDEFPNIGAIPDFTKKISTLRSRGIVCFVIFQNIAQLQNRYPDNGWSEILGNCNAQLFLGATDDLTAKQVSDHIGVTTVKNPSIKRELSLEKMLDPGSLSEGSAKRNLMNPDEITKLDKKKAILMINGQQPLLLYKFDYSQHELYSELRDTEVRNYRLPWAEKYYPAEQEMIEKAKRDAKERERSMSIDSNKGLIGIELLKYRMLKVINKYLAEVKIKLYKKLSGDSSIKDYLKYSEKSDNNNRTNSTTDSKPKNNDCTKNEVRFSTEVSESSSSYEERELSENQEENKSADNSLDVLNEFFGDDDLDIENTNTQDVKKEKKSTKVKSNVIDNNERTKELKNKIKRKENDKEQLNFFNDKDSFW